MWRNNGRPGATGPDFRGDEYSSPSVPFGLADSSVTTPTGATAGQKSRASSNAIRPPCCKALLPTSAAVHPPSPTDAPSHRTPRPAVRIRPATGVPAVPIQLPGFRPAPWGPSDRPHQRAVLQHSASTRPPLRPLDSLITAIRPLRQGDPLSRAQVGHSWRASKDRLVERCSEPKQPEIFL